jgi:hypothetical protein
MQVRSLAMLVGVVSSGCAAVAPEPGARASVGAAVKGDPCPEWGCGANSPVVSDLAGFHELSLVTPDGDPSRTIANAEGYSIAAVQGSPVLVQRGRRYALRVQDGRISGQCAAPCTALDHAALIGATIPVVNGATTAAIQIADVREIDFFVAPELRPGTIEAYTLKWIAQGGATANLCNNIALLETVLKGQADYAPSELMNLEVWESVVFEGDRIDKTSKLMSRLADDRWFNIGCAGSALAKLRMSRNTIHGQLPAGQPASAGWARRQATMRLLTADYCGGGTALTVAGQRLAWQGDGMSYFSPPTTLEARWDETGATCLVQPRLAVPSSALGAESFPNIHQSITDACAAVGRAYPPLCSPASDLQQETSLRVSANR